MAEAFEFVPISSRLYDELDAAQRLALETVGDVKATDEEKRNGWTEETLALYLAERKAGQSLAIDPDSLQRRIAARPKFANHRYNPHRWRG